MLDYVFKVLIDRNMHRLCTATEKFIQCDGSEQGIKKEVYISRSCVLHPCLLDSLLKVNSYKDKIIISTPFEDNFSFIKEVNLPLNSFIPTVGGSSWHCMPINSNLVKEVSCLGDLLIKKYKCPLMFRICSDNAEVLHYDAYGLDTSSPVNLGFVYQSGKIESAINGLFNVFDWYASKTQLVKDFTAVYTVGTSCLSSNKMCVQKRDDGEFSLVCC